MSAFFGELYLRSTQPFLDPKVTAAELDYLAQRFEGLGVAGPLLDFGCGHGRHLEVGARVGRRAVGLDCDALSLGEAHGLRVRGDFFRAPFRDRAFAGVWAWYNAIFTFEDAQIRALFAELGRLVRPGGLLVVHTLPIEKIAAEPASHYAGDLPDGSHLEERVTFNPATRRDEGRRTLRLPDGRVLEADYFIRYHALAELEAMLEVVGFRTTFVHGGLDGAAVTATSADLIVGAQRG